MAPLSFFLCTLLTVALLSFHGVSGVKYTVINTVPQSPGGIRFEKELGIPFCKQVMEKGYNFILSTVFKQNNPSERKPVDSINVYITGPFKDKPDGVAFKWDNNINISCVQLEKWNYRGPQKWDVKMEYTAVLYHEMTHVLQWGGGGYAPAPGGLTEGIADFTKIKANLMQPGFVKPGQGTKWDEGYDNTARFLEYCDGLAPGFVANINKKMKSAYSDSYFKELTGKPVDQLWKEYKAKYGSKY